MGLLSAAIGAGASILGGALSSKSSAKASAMNYQQQKEFAQNQIQWRTEDARKSGISPLYALGANTSAYTPSGTATDWTTPLANAGSSLGRGIDSVLSRKGQREQEAQAIQQNRLKTENASLQNDYLRAQIALLKQQGSTPGIPNPDAEEYLISGQGDSGFNKRVKSSVDWAVDRNGQLMAIPSEEFADSTDDDLFSKWDWNLRNRLLPLVGFNQKSKSLPDGYYWDGISVKKKRRARTPEQARRMGYNPHFGGLFWTR